MARALIKVPATARRGEIIEIRTLIAHPMETGHRADSDGRKVPRDIIRRFACRYNGETVFSAELFPAIAANPYSRSSRSPSTAERSTFSWEGDNGFAQRRPWRSP